MSKFKILFTDSPTNDVSIEEEIVKDAGGDLIFGGLAGNKSREELIELAKDVDGIITDVTKIDRKMIENAQNCKVVVRTGIGYDAIDIEAASEKGIYACNVPSYCLSEVADHAMAGALALGRKLFQANSETKSGKWDIDSLMPILPFDESTFGLYGFGKISQNLAKKAQIFGFRIMVCDPFIDEKTASEHNVELVDMDTLLIESDYLSLHAPLLPETEGVINKDALSKMKRSAYIINTSRGGLIDEDALYNALKNKEIAGAALDVLAVEPPNKDNPMFTLDNVILSPHAAFYSTKSDYRLRVLYTKEAVRGAMGEKPLNIVNIKMLKNNKKI